MEEKATRDTDEVKLVLALKTISIGFIKSKRKPSERIKAAIMRNVEEKWVFGVYVLVFGIKYNQHEENK